MRCALMILFISFTRFASKGEVIDPIGVVVGEDAFLAQRTLQAASEKASNEIGSRQSLLCSPSSFDISDFAIDLYGGNFGHLFLAPSPPYNMSYVVFEARDPRAGL